MATETEDFATAIQFLRDASEEPGAVEAAQRLLRETAATEARAPTPRVFASGWWSLEGVLVVGTSPASDGQLPAVVTATNERALRDLLLALPRGRQLCLQVGADWHLASVTELLEGEPAPGRAGCFMGMKKGGPRATHAPAARVGEHSLLDKRDPVVQLLRELVEPAGREEHGMFVVEGHALVHRAVVGGLPVQFLVHTAALSRSPRGSRLLERARAEGLPCWRASEGLMGTLTPTRPLPDALAAVHLRLRDGPDLSANRATTVLAAEDLQNPDNLGMVLRTADAAGVEAVVVAGRTTDPLHRGCVRAARGAVGRIPIFRCAGLPEWAEELRERGFQVVGATARGDVELFDADLAPPIAVIVGNEETGLRRETLAACSTRVAIPMAPGQDSLNVGVAAGVLLFELVRQRQRRRGRAAGSVDSG